MQSRGHAYNQNKLLNINSGGTEPKNIRFRNALSALYFEVFFSDANVKSSQWCGVCSELDNSAAMRLVAPSATTATIPPCAIQYFRHYSMQTVIQTEDQKGKEITL